MASSNHNIELFSLKDAADAVDLSPNRVRQLAKAGTIGSVPIDRTFVFTPDNLEQLKQYVATSKPGPKGPRTKKPAGGRKAA